VKLASGEGKTHQPIRHALTRSYTLAFQARLTLAFQARLCLSIVGEVSLPLRQSYALTIWVRLPCLSRKSLIAKTWELLHVLFSFFSDANMLVFALFVVHYATGPTNSLFRSVKKMDGSIHFQFQGNASLFSDRSSPERDALLLAVMSVSREVFWSLSYLKITAGCCTKATFHVRGCDNDTDQ